MGYAECPPGTRKNRRPLVRTVQMTPSASDVIISSGLNAFFDPFICTNGSPLSGVNDQRPPEPVRVVPGGEDERLEFGDEVRADEGAGVR